MKHHQVLLLVGIVILGCSRETGFPWHETTFAAAQMEAGERIIMLDFYTEW